MKTHHVYRIFDKAGRLLYIGSARDVETRVYMHRRTFGMVDAFLIHRHYASHTSEPIGTLEEARAAERDAIKAEAPILNRQHNPSRWRRVDGQYQPVTAETVELMAELHRKPEPNPDMVAFFASFGRAAS